MLKFISLFNLILLFQVISAVKIDVYYEALCPDSKEFITTQLTVLNRDPEFRKNLQISLIPFGKAEQFIDPKGKITFKCQHGPLECEANMYQACVLKNYDINQSLDLANCIMSERNPNSFIEKCTKSLGLDYDKLKKCQNEEGPQLLSEYGKMTKSIKGLYFIPWVVVDGDKEMSQFQEILYNLKKVVCDKIKGEKPKSC